MNGTERVNFLRGVSKAGSNTPHPIIELSDEELRLIVGGEQFPGDASTSVSTSSYNNSGAACCDGTKVCCDI